MENMDHEEEEAQEECNEMTAVMAVCSQTRLPVQSSSSLVSSDGILSKSLTTSRPLRTCTVLCMSFLFAYTAHLAIQNLQSTLNEEGMLGITSLAVLFGTIVVFGPFAPVFIRVLSAKRSLVIAWVAHTLYTLSNFRQAYDTLVTASLLLGIVSGPMWTAQSLYISASGAAYAQERNVDLHVALSKFNGIFFACYETTQITGNLISSLVLSRSTYNTSYLTLPGRICGADMCPAGAEPSDGNSTESPNKIEPPARYIVYMLLAIYLACNLAALVFTVVSLPHLETEKEAKVSEDSLGQSIVSCMSMLLNPRMLLLLPFFMAQAMNSGILMADYTQKFVGCALGIQWVGYVMAAFGLLTAVQAVGLNFAAKYIPRQVLFPAAALADMCVDTAMLVWNPLGHSVGTFFILPVVSGFAEGIFQAQFYSLVAMVFPDRLTGAFAAYHTSKSVAFTIHFALANFLCLWKRLYIALALSGVGLLGYVIVEVSLLLERKNRGYDLRHRVSETVSVGTQCQNGEAFRIKQSSTGL